MVAYKPSQVLDFFSYIPSGGLHGISREVCIAVSFHATSHHYMNEYYFVLRLIPPVGVISIIGGTTQHRMNVFEAGYIEYDLNNVVTKQYFIPN